MTALHNRRVMSDEVDEDPDEDAELEELLFKAQMEFGVTYSLQRAIRLLNQRIKDLRRKL